MSVKIKLKHSAVPGKAPLPSDLDNGELALNTNAASPAAYIKDSAGNIVKLAGAGSASTPDATKTVKGIVQLADAAAITAGIPGRVVDAAQLKAVSDADDWARTGTTLAPKTAGDVVNISAGTAALPGLTPVGDPNTGIYSPGADQVAVSTGGTERISITANGDINIDNGGVFYDATNNRLGIRNTSPGAALDVLTGSSRYVRFSTNGDASLIRTTEGGGFNRGFSVAGEYIKFDTGTNASSTINEAARIDQDGRLLVGTSTAHNVGGKPGIAQFSGTGAQVHFVSTSTSPSCINLAAGSNGTDVTSATSLGRIQFFGYHTNGYDTGARIEAAVDGTPGDGDMPTRLVFATTAAGASTPTERMRIRSSGIINFTNAPVYADNTAAKAGGLANGDIYRKADGTLMITF